MTKIYKRKNVPETILKKFIAYYGSDVTFNFYTYKGREGEKVYGALAFKNGKLYGNAYQISN